MKNRRKLTLLTLVVALAAAVYLNWQYAQSETSFTTDGTQVNATVSDPLQTEESVVKEELPDKNYGDAQLVSAAQESGDKYFEQARLTRSQTRDEALDKLQKTLKNAQLSSEEKAQLTQSLSKTVDSITAESEIENVIIAKGFADCVVFVDGDKVSVAVKTGSNTLDSSSVAQIRDAVISKTDTAAKNINVVEVK